MIITNDTIKEATLQQQSRIGNMLAIDAGDTKSYAGSGSIWYDLSGNGNNVTLQNSPTFTNNYFTFNGTDQYGIANHSDTLSVNGLSMTIEYWMYWLGGDVFAVISKSPYTGGPSNQNGNYMVQNYFVDPDNTNLYFLSNDGLNNVSYQYGQSMCSRTNAWFQYVVVIDNGVFKFFRNGTLYNTVSNTVSSLKTTTEDLLIGKRKDNFGYVNGRLSIVNLFDYALSDNDVRSNFNFYRTRFGI